VPGLAVLRRSDTGKDQLTYQGKPLYTFKLDKAAGQHTGHNLTDDFAGVTFTWRAATTTATTEAQPASDPGNYDY
jgi:predicted lipoprotein with Yx(FWY)xxD motif